MSTIINTRSPFYKKITNANLHSVKLELIYLARNYMHKELALIKDIH